MFQVFMGIVVVGLGLWITSSGIVFKCKQHTNRYVEKLQSVDNRTVELIGLLVKKVSN